MIMRKIAKYVIIIFVISLPFQWILLDNFIVSGVNTLICIFLILRYMGRIK